MPSLQDLVSEPSEVDYVEFHTSTLSGRQWPTFRTCHDLFIALQSLVVDHSGGLMVVEIMPGQASRMRVEHVLQTISTCTRELAEGSDIVSHHLVEGRGRRFLTVRVQAGGSQSAPSAHREDRVLAALETHGPLTTRQLYTMLGWTRPTTRRVLLRLIDSGHVETMHSSRTSPTQRYRAVGTSSESSS